MILENHQQFVSPEEALVHYGKKGMKWGVRNEEKPVGRDSGGQVTPSRKDKLLERAGEANTKISELRSERKQAKVDKFLKRADVMDTKISEIKRANEELSKNLTLTKRYTRYTNKQSIKELDRSQKRAVKDAEATKKGKLTSTQKKIVIGAVGVSAIIATGAIYRGQQSGALNSYMLRGGALLRGQKTPFKVNKELSKTMSAEDLLHKIAKPVNPGYSKAGGKMNCRRSTYAYELRRRGFDVHATTSAVGWGQSESGVINAVSPGGKKFYRQMSMSQTVVDTGFSSVAKGDTRVNPLKKIMLDNLVAERPSFSEQAAAIRANGGRMPESMQKLIDSAGTSSSKKVLEELAKQPNGARGEVVFKFSGFGHSMAYEVVDGVPHIFDSQKGTLYNAAGKMVESKWDGFTAAEITRLDNVDLDLNFLSRWATND